MYETGAFLLTHQGIAIDTDGNLVDGQHRLNAILKYGGSVKMLIAYNTDSEAFRGMDRGTTRTISDITGFERDVTDVVSFIIEVYLGSRVTSNAKEMEPFLKIFARPVVELKNYCGTLARQRSVASVRAAAAVCMLDRDSDFAMKAYARLIKLDFGSMTHKEHDFTRYLTKIPSRAGKYRNDIFVRALLAFDEGCSAVSVVIRNPEWHRDNAKLRVRHLVNGMAI